MQQLVHPSVN